MKKKISRRLLELKVVVEKISAHDIQECVEWPYYSSAYGYGRIKLSQNRTSAVHRIAFSIFHDREVDSLGVICHKCDNPRCFNPFHLYEGTPSSNAKDRWARGPSRIAKEIAENGGTSEGERMGKLMEILRR